ncbi:hypothetical protein [Catellatospora methionotrophica]
MSEHRIVSLYVEPQRSNGFRHGRSVRHDLPAHAGVHRGPAG